MSPKREIKVPAAQRWREFRMRVLPIAVFAMGLVAATMLWKETVVGPTMAGTVEAIQTAVISPDAGVVTNLLVRQFQLVKKGDPVAEVVVTDVRQVSSQVQDMRSRIAMSQLELSSIMDRQRIGFDYQALSMNTLRFRAELAAAKAELPTLESVAERYEAGWKDKVIPFNDYQLAIRERDAAQARITELSRLVTEAETRLKQAGETAGIFTNITSPTTIVEAMRRLRSEREEANQDMRTPVVLRAPIDGTVGLIMRRPGENVLAGDTILTINALEGERIVAYVRQGSSIMPTKGMPVTVRCRNRARDQAVSEIAEIGHHYEAITNVSLIRPGAPFEMGIPIAIAIPGSLRSVVRPGEVVDLGLETP